MEVHKPNDFVFASKYHVWRHVVFWLAHIAIFTLIWSSQSKSLVKVLFGCLIYVPVLMLHCYPLIYWVFPQFLLKGKYFTFTLIMLAWAIVGWFLNYYFRAFIFIPVQQFLYFERVPVGIYKGSFNEGNILELVLTTGFVCVIVLFKYWMIKQREWMQVQQEKVTAELQLLKAQVHPHFLFNTLNNIYAFSLEYSPKTPVLILKLSSLLSYMLNDCKADQVLLEKEIEIMKNYIGLERERYGNKIEISFIVKGNIKDKYITPLLLLPFLENAFKHGTSELLERPWLKIDIAIKNNTLQSKIVNSKTDTILERKNGIGIENVKKRLALLYPGKHELIMNNQEDFFEVLLLIELISDKITVPFSSFATLPLT